MISDLMSVTMKIMSTSLKTELNQPVRIGCPWLHGNEKPGYVRDELRFYGGLFTILVWLIL